MLGTSSPSSTSTSLHTSSHSDTSSPSSTFSPSNTSSPWGTSSPSNTSTPLGTSSPLDTCDASGTSSLPGTSRTSGTSSPSGAYTPGTSSPSHTGSLSSICAPWVPPVPRIPPLPWVLPVTWIPAMPLVEPPVLRVPPVPPAPANHVDQSQRSLPFKYQTHVGGGDDKTRPSPAHTLPLSRSNSRSDNRPSKCHPDVGCSQSSASYLPMGRVPASTRPAGPAKTMADDRRRRERVERCVDMCLFVLLVLICVGLAVCLVFMSF